MDELGKLAGILSARYTELSKGNPTLIVCGALLAIKEIVSAIHAVRGEPEHKPGSVTSLNL